MTALTIGGDGCGGDSGRMADDTIGCDKIRSDNIHTGKTRQGGIPYDMIQSRAANVGGAFNFCDPPMRNLCA